MTALYHDHVRPDGAEGGNLLRRADRIRANIAAMPNVSLFKW